MVKMDARKRPANIAVIKQELQSIATQELIGKTNLLEAGIPAACRPPALPRISKQATLPKPQKPTGHICTGHTSRVTAVPWSPGGTQIATASYDKTVRVWDASQGSSIITYRGHWDRVQAVAWSPDSRRIASAGDDGTVQVSDATTGQHVLTYRGHAHAVSSLAW